MSTTDLVEKDAQIAEYRAMPGTMESIAWLQSGSEDNPHTLSGCLTHEESLAYAQEILAMGAVSVMSVPPSAENVTSRIRSLMVIELPEDPDVQQKLYDWNVEISLKSLGNATDDIGTTQMLHFVDCPVDDSDLDDDDEYDEYDEE